MKKIVILTCKKASRVCTGAACLKAFNQKTKTFEQYLDEPIELEAFSSAAAALKKQGRNLGRGNGGKGRTPVEYPSVSSYDVFKKKKGSSMSYIQRVADRLKEQGAVLVDGSH